MNNWQKIVDAAEQCGHVVVEEEGSWLRIQIDSDGDGARTAVVHRHEDAASVSHWWSNDDLSQSFQTAAVEIDLDDPSFALNFRVEVERDVTDDEWLDVTATPFRELLGAAIRELNRDFEKDEKLEVIGGAAMVVYTLITDEIERRKSEDA